MLFHSNTQLRSESQFLDLLKGFGVALLCVLFVPSIVLAQITITEINPNQSTLSDPDGASGGRVNHLAGDKSNNAVFYAASEFGGLYKSTDRGLTWARLNGHLPTVTWDVKTNPADPRRVYATSFFDGRASSLAGINVSTDGGATWTHRPSATPPAGFCEKDIRGGLIVDARRSEPSAFGISVDPDNPNNVYIGTNCGLAISNDRGDTWRYVDPTPAGPADDIWSVVVHDNGIIDLCGDDGHRRSTDGGNTWTAAPVNGLPSGRCSLAVSPYESSVLVATIGDNIFESDDGGGSWSVVSAGAEGRISFVSTNKRVKPVFDLWFGNVTLYRVSCGLFGPAVGASTRCPAIKSLKNANGGAECPPPSPWTGCFTRSVGGHDDTGDLAFDTSISEAVDPNCEKTCKTMLDQCMANLPQPSGPQAQQCIQEFKGCINHCPTGACAVLMSSDGGVYVNTHTSSPACHAPGWKQPTITPHGLWLFGMTGVYVHGTGAEYVYFGNQDNGSYASGNADAASPTWHNRDCCDSFDDAADALRVLYTLCCFSKKPTNRLVVRRAGMVYGGEVDPYPPGELRGFERIDILDRFADNSYVVLTDKGVFITKDVAAHHISWTQLGVSSSPADACGIRAAGSGNNVVFYLEAGSCSGSDADTLWSYVGTDPGGAWERLQFPGNGGVGIFGVDRVKPKRILASVIAGGNVQMMLSNDGGSHWAGLAALDKLMTSNGQFLYRNYRGPTDFTGFGGYVQPTLAAFSPYDQNTLLAAGADSGIFLSKDAGNSWTIVTDNSGTLQKPHIPRPEFAQFSRHRGFFNIYVGTQGRGVWRLRYPDTVGAACLAQCKTNLDACMAQAGHTGPASQQCILDFKNCESTCP